MICCKINAYKNNLHSTLAISVEHVHPNNCKRWLHHVPIKLQLTWETSNNVRKPLERKGTILNMFRLGLHFCHSIDMSLKRLEYPCLQHTLLSRFFCHVPWQHLQTTNSKKKHMLCCKCDLAKTWLKGILDGFPYPKRDDFGGDLETSDSTGVIPSYSYPHQSLCNTVDGQNPAPPRMMIIPLFIGL